MLKKVFSRSVFCVLLWLCVAGIFAQQKQPDKPTPKPPDQLPVVKPEKKEEFPQSKQQSQGPIDKIHTEVVTMSVTVTDPYNRLVTGLDRQHFEVFEDKVKQSIEYFRDEDVPVSVGIIFDVSGSMKGKLDRAREALKAFIQTCHDQDDFFLVGFNQRANLIAEFTDGDSLTNKLTLINPSGQTALYDAAFLGIEKVKQGRHNKRAILQIGRAHV